MSTKYNHTSRKHNKFDSYAEGYLAGMENPIKRLLGGSFEAFIRVKAKWLLTDLSRNPLTLTTFPENIRLLDFGCGSGELLQTLRKMGFKGKLEGCDVSEKMLKEAVKRWNCGSVPPLHLIREGNQTPFAENFYDVVVACSVFHHIDLSKHSEVFTELLRILKHGGRIVLFEHNPLNPVTRYIVDKTPIDYNVVFITARKTREMMSLARLNSIRVNYFLFFPPRLQWRWLKRLEHILWWVPFGGQYVVVGEKPTSYKGYPSIID